MKEVKKSEVVGKIARKKNKYIKCINTRTKSTTYYNTKTKKNEVSWKDVVR